MNLIFMNSPNKGQLIELKEEGTRFGRIEDETDVFLDDVEVSGHHAVVEKVGRAWRVYDLNSTNGTFVNNKRIPGSAKLKLGDSIRLGETILLFTDESEVAFPAEDRPRADTLAETMPREVAELPEDARSPETRVVEESERGERILPSDSLEAAREIAEARVQIEEEIGKQVMGQQQFVRNILITILAGGHAIIRGGPGLGKTLLVATLARTVGLVWRRIRLTQDTEPDHLDKIQAANLLLAVRMDDAPPRTQAVLLEWLRDPHLNPDGQRSGRRPFHLLAALDPREWGPHVMRHSDLDAFLTIIYLDPPSAEDEKNIIAMAAHARVPAIDRICDRDAVLEMQELVTNLAVSEDVAEYAVTLSRATRPECGESPNLVRENVSFGCSVRGGQALLHCAKANAVLDGRDEVTRDDIRAVAYATLSHRIGVTAEAYEAGITEFEMIAAILETHA